MKLLLHLCCGPCATYPVQVLQNEQVSFEGYFYNPNIHPMDEFTRRRENALLCSQSLGFRLHSSDAFMEDTWQNFGGSAEERCIMCYSLRLEEAARFAKERGFDAFTSTLFVSPYQNHDLMKKLGYIYAEKYALGFYYVDFRPGFRKGQNTAREMGLYRQKYCGCIKSLRAP